MKQRSFIEKIESIAPLKGACSWDSSGLQIISEKDDVTTCVVVLDLTIESIDYALSCNADIIIAHHPLSLSPPILNQERAYSPLLRLLVKHNIAFYVAHTSLDSTTHSIAGFLTNTLHLHSIKPIDRVYSHIIESYMLYTQEHEPLKEAMLSHGIQYEEFRVSNMFSIVLLNQVYHSIMRSLLNEFNIIYTVMPTQQSTTHFGIGCIGKCKNPISKEELFHILKTQYDISTIALHGIIPDTISTLAYCPGAGSSFVEKLHKETESIDVYITGEIKHHDAIYSTIPLIDVGHFALEEAMMKIFAETLQQICPTISILFYKTKTPFTHITL